MLYVDTVISDVLATAACLVEIQQKLAVDPVCKIIAEYCEDAWPSYEKPSISVVTKPYWQVCDKLSVCEGLLMKGNRIVQCVRKSYKNYKSEIKG